MRIRTTLNVVRTSGRFLKLAGFAVARGLGWFVRTLGVYHGVVTAIATAVLAVVTWAYLKEVREQRLFNYTQLALENRPVVEISTLAPFEFGGLLRTAAAVTNRGGTLENLRVGVVILCCLPVEEAVLKPGELQVLPWGRYTPRLARNQHVNYYLGITEEQRKWLEPALKDAKVSGVHAYVRAEYTRPANPIEPASDSRDSMSFWWNPNFNQWMHMSPEGHKYIGQIIEARQVFEPPATLR